jgi:hypothetical protein
MFSQIYTVAENENSQVDVTTINPWKISSGDLWLKKPIVLCSVPQESISEKGASIASNMAFLLSFPHTGSIII